jgi:multiple sugar transport system substrate-binding protein
MTDLAEYLGSKYGGWYPVTRKYGMLRDRWIALPQGSPIGTFNYRVSAMRAAGFEEFPKDTAGFLKLCRGLRKVGRPAGFSLGHATGDANGWTGACGPTAAKWSTTATMSSSTPRRLSQPLNTPCSST